MRMQQERRCCRKQNHGAPVAPVAPVAGPGGCPEPVPCQADRQHWQCTHLHFGYIGPAMHSHVVLSASETFVSIYYIC
jgi:hypothetical protein